MKICLSAALSALALMASPVTAQQLGEGTPLSIARSHVVHSAILGADRVITIRLPAEYAAEPERRFPVVYLLDGGPEQDFIHIAGIAQSREMNYSFEPFILVGIESVNRRHELSPPVVEPGPYIEGLGAEPGGSAQYRRWLGEELMPLIEANYRTDGHDAIIGESLAALFVVETLFEQPSLFEDYIAISPSLWWEEMKFGREAPRFLAEIPADLPQRRLYLTVANEGTWHREGMERLVDALRDAAPANLRWTFVPVEGSETHGTILHPMALDAMRALYGTPMREYKPVALIGGSDEPDFTPEELARREVECTVENSRPTTPAASAQGMDRLYYECLLYDLGPLPREGNLDD